MYQKRRVFENTIIIGYDLVALIVSSGIAFWLRFHQFFGSSRDGDQIWQIFALCLLHVMIVLMIDGNRHFFRRTKGEGLAQILKSQILLAAVWILMLYMTHRTDVFSRLTCGYLFVSSVVLMAAGHQLIKKYMVKVYKNSRYSNRMLLITTVDKVEGILDNLTGYNEWSRRLDGIILMDESHVGDEIQGVPVVADEDTWEDYGVHHDVDEAFIALPKAWPQDKLQEVVSCFEMMGVMVDVNIDAFDLYTGGKKELNRVGKYSVVSFVRNLYSFKEMVMKRLLDICGSLVGMILLAIATIFVAPAIKLESPGPVFFGQTRVGKNGRTFTFYKFRSMYQDAEARKKELMEKNEVKGLMFKMEDDPRITKVGKFIRKTSIDELPQFWNILKGDMSLVGTRPPTVDEFERYESKHKCRLSMTPGLTGQWQVSGRSDIKDFEEVVRLDMSYIDDWTIWKDIKILFQTVYIVFVGKGSR